MNTQTKSRLVTLRSYSSFKDWNDCAASASDLLRETPEETAINVIARQLRRFVSDLHMAYPDDLALESAQSMVANVTVREELVESTVSVNDLLSNRSNQPGINNFRNTLTRLHKHLAAFDAETGQHIEVGDGLQGILMAILDLHWGNRNSDLWNRWFRRQDRSDWFLGPQFAADPGIRELGRQLWSQVADDIEAGLDH